MRRGMVFSFSQASSGIEPSTLDAVGTTTPPADVLSGYIRRLKDLIRKAVVQEGTGSFDDGVIAFGHVVGVD